MELFSWYNVLIILAVLLSIPKFFGSIDQNKKKHVVIFLILALTAIVEWYGQYLRLSGQNNTIVYNIGYVLIGLSLKFYFFSQAFQDKKEKMLVLLLWTTFMVWSFSNFLFFQTLGEFHHYSLAFGSFLLIALCFYFFFRIFFKNKYENQNLLAVPEFWIISFFMFFYACSFFYFISFSFFLDGMDLALVIQLNFLIRVLGCIMYLIMGLAFYAPLVFKSDPILISN